MFEVFFKFFAGLMAERGCPMNWGDRISALGFALTAACLLVFAGQGQAQVTSESWMDYDLAGPRGAQRSASWSANYPYFIYRLPTYSMNAATGSSLKAQDNTASIEVLVPAGAKLWFDNNLTRETGTVRYFSTPELQPGRTFKYEVRASWIDDSGRAVTKTQEVSVEAGKRTVVGFDFVVAVAR
jgi:uncharacterized protein (TIGR03000 family)